RGRVRVARGRVGGVGPPSVLAWGEAVAVRAALALLDGADDRSVCGGERGRAFQGLRGKGGADSAQGGHGRSPCMRALRRSEASSCPVWVRWKETIVVSRWVCPRER